MSVDARKVAEQLLVVEDLTQNVYRLRYSITQFLQTWSNSISTAGTLSPVFGEQFVTSQQQVDHAWNNFVRTAEALTPDEAMVFTGTPPPARQGVMPTYSALSVQTFASTSSPGNASLPLPVNVLQSLSIAGGCADAGNRDDGSRVGSEVPATDGSRPGSPGNGVAGKVPDLWFKMTQRNLRASETDYLLNVFLKNSFPGVVEGNKRWKEELYSALQSPDSLHRDPRRAAALLPSRVTREGLRLRGSDISGDVPLSLREELCRSIGDSIGTNEVAKVKVAVSTAAASWVTVSVAVQPVWRLMIFVPLRPSKGRGSTSIVCSEAPGEVFDWSAASVSVFAWSEKVPTMFAPSSFDAFNQLSAHANVALGTFRQQRSRSSADVGRSLSSSASSSASLSLFPFSAASPSFLISFVQWFVRHYKDLFSQTCKCHGCGKHLAFDQSFSNLVPPLCRTLRHGVPFHASCYSEAVEGTRLPPGVGNIDSTELDWYY